MITPAMKKGLEVGAVVDVGVYPKDPNGYYLLPNDLDIDGKDLCDAQRERWIWSVGRRLDGQIIASVKTDLYQCKNIECLWLR